MSGCPVSSSKSASPATAPVPAGQACSSPSNSSGPSNNSQPDKSLKPCCACPETRKARDECVLLRGEENCQDYINSHKDCLKSYGFQV